MKIGGCVARLGLMGSGKIGGRYLGRLCGWKFNASFACVHNGKLSGTPGQKNADTQNSLLQILRCGILTTNVQKCR